MEKNFQIVKRENESLEKIDQRPVLLVNDIAKLVSSSALIKPQYKSVKIGNQIWMVENLNVDHYRNGDLIPEVTEKEEWAKLKTGAWCYYNNDTENGKKYGKLYNWYAVNDPRGLATQGWHIPTKAEFQTLALTVNNDGNTLKAIGQAFGKNTSGFSALLAGYRGYFGYFYFLGSFTDFWIPMASDEMNAISANLNDEGGSIKFNRTNKGSGFSIRCVKD